MDTLPPDRSLGHMIRDVNRLFQKELGRRIAAHGVTLGQWYALRVLWIQDGLTQAEISQRAGVAPPGIVSALRGLIKRGIVVRDRHPTDQRKNIIFLTKRGRQLENLCIAEARQVNEMALAEVPPDELDICLRVLHIARRRIETVAADLEEVGEAV